MRIPGRTSCVQDERVAVLAAAAAALTHYELYAFPADHPAQPPVRVAAPVPWCARSRRHRAGPCPLQVKEAKLPPLNSWRMGSADRFPSFSLLPKTTFSPYVFAWVLLLDPRQKSAGDSPVPHYFLSYFLFSHIVLYSNPPDLFLVPHIGSESRPCSTTPTTAIWKMPFPTTSCDLSRVMGMTPGAGSISRGPRGASV